MIFSTISNKRITKILHIYIYMYTYYFFLTYRRSHSSIHFVALLSFSIFTFFFRYSAKVYLSLAITCFLRVSFDPFRALTIYRFGLLILFPRIVRAHVFSSVSLLHSTRNCTRIHTRRSLSSCFLHSLFYLSNPSNPTA